ncbi:MAG TPA: metal ABC transporter substrate-binding protein [Candidatus Paceibacterota bacterium]|nr:metal ABC transporter substrate-binding protein [Verrucomicrobiota bacterium]HRY47986.1 metal ABC transporter substrate-binding protein [Candidatus Paceibacterota bacterium]
MKPNLTLAVFAAWLSVIPLLQARLNVVATTPDFAAVAKSIGGDLVEITTLARPTEDPHFVDAKPSLILKLNRAEVLLEGGAELEAGWLPSLLAGARNPRIAAGSPGHVVCNQDVPMMETPATLDRSEGDIHARGNPHYMTDPANARIVASHLADVFCRIDPKSAETYRANLKKFLDELAVKMADWHKTLAPYQGRQMVAYHNAWPYFARRFGLKIALFLEPKPGLPPTPTHLAEVIARMKKEQVSVIFVEPYLDRRTAETVARGTGAKVIDVAYLPGGIKGTENDYIKLMDYLVTSVAKALADPAK